MEMRKPSRTAVSAAIWRALHLLLDHEPKILVDPFARFFAGYPTDEELVQASATLPTADLPWIRTPFVVRSRYAEDELAQAIESGVKQYIILGAGLDSFPYRQPVLMQSLAVYEVDHPASQAWKRNKVKELGIEVPLGLHYAPIDFEMGTLTEGLIATRLFNATRLQVRTARRSL